MPQLRVLSEPWGLEKYYEELKEEEGKNKSVAVQQVNEYKYVIKNGGKIKKSEAGVTIDFSFYRTAAEALKIVKKSEIEKIETSGGGTNTKSQKASGGVVSSKRKGLVRSGSGKKVAGRGSSVGSEAGVIAEGLVNICIAVKMVREMTEQQVFEKIAKQYHVPHSRHLELYQKVRIGMDKCNSAYSDTWDKAGVQGKCVEVPAKNLARYSRVTAGRVRSKFGDMYSGVGMSRVTFEATK
ncbi:hypothetical protein AX774_g4480 [Zancudomyces culisetae]|uniref:Uncharacterized protein n=1 Tax=Zancudomyces culisetae TaxID=1213189 RepID=A0A1R1PM68_ZANCU|nr:hypothetical protein AX774_g4480 [Zancudomyces culisetae]|eukprot:OMH82046.1 hypothetical protein AX774_g4480 [Zancudomyces culisetae]